MENHLKVMLIDVDSVRRAQLMDGLVRSACQVTEQSTLSVDIIERLASAKPEVVVMGADAPDRGILECLQMISHAQPVPIVLFTDNEDEIKIKQAIHAGATSYIIKGIEPSRIKPILRVAITRFKEQYALRTELDNAKAELAERKLIERAKGMLMRQKGINEEDAYQLLRKMAMNRKVKIAELANQLIDLSELLA